MISGKSANTIIAKTSKIPKLRRKSFITAPFGKYEWAITTNKFFRTMGFLLINFYIPSLRLII